MCSLKILDSKEVDLGLKIENCVHSGKLCFSLDPPLVLEPNVSYTLRIDDDHGRALIEEVASQQKQLEVKGSVVFYLWHEYQFHCFRGFEFRL